jgi:hypothetical protein
VPSGCVPYTGVINESISKDLPCKPNINDVISNIQKLIDSINSGLGDNTELDKNCFSFTPSTIKQSELNQIFIDELCQIKKDLTTITPIVDPKTLDVAINLLCLQTPSCAPQATYSLQEVLEKLITAYCGLLTRVKTIETILNI